MHGVQSVNVQSVLHFIFSLPFLNFFFGMCLVFAVVIGVYFFKFLVYKGQERTLVPLCHACTLS